MTKKVKSQSMKAQARQVKRVGGTLKPPRQKQGRLPGMEDSPIKDLEEAAIEHSDTLGEIRGLRDGIKKIDERIATLMKREGLKTYNHAGITLKLREGEESVSVKVKRHDREEESGEKGSGE